MDVTINPVTVTKELFCNHCVSEEAMAGLAAVRVQAGAARSIYRKDGDFWVLETEWALISQRPIANLKEEGIVEK